MDDRSVVLACSVALLTACASVPRREPRTLPAIATWDAHEPAGFNQLAQRLNAPVFWVADTNANGAPDPDEVRALLFYPRSYLVWVEGGSFRPAFEELAARIEAASSEPEPTDRRRALVRRQLDEGHLALHDTDLRDASQADRTFVRRMLEVTARIDALYARQVGMEALAPRLDVSDDLSASAFRVGWGQPCDTWVFGTEECTPIAGVTFRRVDLYPRAIQDPVGAFCEQLEREPDLEYRYRRARDLRRSVVRDVDGRHHGDIGFAYAYDAEVHGIADALREAADALVEVGERSLESYLRLSAVAFVSDDWEPASDAWDRLGPSDRWFVQVGTRTSEADLCGVRELPHVVLGRYVTDGDTLRADAFARASEMFASFGADWPTLVARDTSPDSHQRVDVVFAGGESRPRAGGPAPFSSGGPGPLFSRARIVDAVPVSSRQREEADVLFAAPSPCAAEDRGFASVSLALARRIRPVAFDREHVDATAEMLFAAGYVMRLAFGVWLAEHGVVEPGFARSQIAAIVSSWLAALPWELETPGADGGVLRRGALLVQGFLFEHGVVRWDERARSVHGEIGAFAIEEATLFDAVHAAARDVLHIWFTHDLGAYAALVDRWVSHTPIPISTIENRLSVVGYTTHVYSVQF